MAKKVKCEECQHHCNGCKHPENRIVIVKYRQEKEKYINTNQNGDCKLYAQLCKE